MKLKDLLTEVLTEGALYKKGDVVQYQLDKGSPHALKPSSGKISKVQKVGNYYQYTIMDGGPVPVWEIEILPAADKTNQPDPKDLSMINKARAKAALRQIKSGKRDDGMGEFTARLFGVTSSGDAIEITDESGLNQYTEFGLAEVNIKEICGPLCKGKKWVGKKLGLSKSQMS